MPFKEAVIPLLDRIEESARVIDSVNTIVNDDGVLTGYNTDYMAVRDLLAERRVPKDAPFLLRGSGGMAKAVVAALRDAGFRRGTVVARNADAGQALAARYGYDWVAEVLAEGAPLLINVTPLGMRGPDSAVLAFPESLIAACDIAFDVVAQPADTPFIRVAEAKGKATVSGAEVIVLQALEQFVLYTGIRPPSAAIRAAVLFAHGPEVAAKLSLLGENIAT
jgi:shikimate dehydrogenase